MRIAKRPTLFFRFFGVGFAHTFHKFYNLPSNTLISFNFFCHSTLRPPFTPIQYARGAFVTYGDSGVALLPVGNTGSGLRLLPYGQYAYAAALFRIRSIRAACAAICRRPIAGGQYGLWATAISPAGLNTPTRLRLLPYGQYAYAAALCRIRSIRAACAAMCSLRCAHTPRLSATPIPIQAASLRSNRGAIPNLFSSPRACAGESIHSSICRCKSSCTKRSNHHTK